MSEKMSDLVAIILGTLVSSIFLKYFMKINYFKALLIAIVGSIAIYIFSFIIVPFVTKFVTKK